MKNLLLAAQILLLPLHLLASNQIFESGSMVRLANPSAGIYDVYWLFDSSNHYFGHYPPQALPVAYDSYFEVGSYTLNSLGNNEVLAELNSAAHATLGDTGGTGSASRTATVTLTSPFSADYSGTRTEISGVLESFNGNLTIYPVQDYAPEVLPTGSVWDSDNAYYQSVAYSGPASGGRITILSSNSLQKYDPEYDQTSTGSYTYTKLGPNLGRVSISDPANYYTANINLFFRSPTEVYFYGNTTDYYGSYTDWGALAATYPSSYSPPAIFPAPSALPQDQILQITGTNSDLSLDLAGGTWTDANGGSGSFTHTYTVQSGGVAGLTLNRSGQNAPASPEHFALRFTDDGVGEVAYSSLDGSQSFNLVDAPTWEPYDNFSGSTIDTQKWDFAYWDGGNLPTPSNGRTLLSGNTVSNWNATEVTEAMLQANGDAVNSVSGGQAHSILEFKDSDSILGIEMELTLPVSVSGNVGIGLYAIDYDVMFNSPNQDPVIFDLDLWNSSGSSSPEVQVTWKDPVSGTEQEANGVPVAAGQTVLLKFERTEDTIRFFVDDIQVAESGYSSGNETFMIRAVSENGYSFLAYVDNVRVLRDTPPVDPSVDTDGDGLSDSVETNTGVYVSPSDTGTNPNNADTDGDGVNDGDEVSNGTDPNEAPGPQLPVIERDGNTYLLEDYSSGYFARSIYSGSANTPLIYQGRQVSRSYPVAAFTAVGVDLVNGTYRLVWSYGSQYYAANFLQSGSSISALTVVSDILTEELSLQQDLNGDGHIGDPPIAPPGPVGKSYVLTALTGELKTVPDQVSFTADTISFGFSGNLLESDSYSYSDGTVIYDTEEVIKFTYTSATGGTYEEGYDEGDGFSVENTGTFEEANINLNLQTNWQRSETMDTKLSTQYWQIGATSGDSVAYNEGELNFIFDSASVDMAAPSDDQAIEISYAGALPLDEDWQIVVDDTYVSDSADGFIMAYQLGSEGSVDYEFGLGAGRGIYFDVYGGPAGPAFYSHAGVSTGPGILTGLNFRIQHLASTRELIFEYQTEGASASEWTEVARINLSTGAANGLSGSGSLTGQLPSSSENLFFGVEIIQFTTAVAIPMENIEIGGIEISTYTPPIEPLDSIAGMQFEYTSIDNVTSVPVQEFYASDGLADHGFSNSIIQRNPYAYSDGVISFPEWSEEIRLTFTDATSGTYAFVELYGGGPMGGEVDDSGTFVVVTPSLEEKTDWQHTETFDSGFSTDYWNIFHDTEDAVEVASGALNFIFAGAGEGVPEPDPNLYYEDYEIDIDYGRTLPMDESWQIVMDDVYGSSSLDDFEFDLELEFEGQGYNFECGIDFEEDDFGVNDISVSFWGDTYSGGASVSTVEDSRIQSNVSLRITHNANSRELVFEYQPNGANAWSELARLNLGSGDFSGLNSNAVQGNGELIGTSQRVAVSLEVEAEETTQVGDIRIGGIEISSYTPPPPPASPESLVGYKLVGQFTEGLASVYRNDFFFTGAATLQGHYGVESNDPSIVDDWSEETYTYQKTGATTGTLAITNSSGETTDVELTFDSATSGTAIANGRNGIRPNSASGPFTFIEYDDSELPDTDGDGLSDSVETNTGVYVSPSDTGTNPNNADTDGDGVNDGDEVSNGTDPNEAPGPQLPVIERDGNTYLLEDYSSGYFARSIYSGSANTPLIYQGRQVSRSYPVAAFTAVGVDLVNGTYRLVWSYGSQYYAANFLQSGSSISALTVVSDILTEELSLQQDLNGDGHIGDPPIAPPDSIEGLELYHGDGVLYFEPQGVYYGGAQNGHINNKGSWEYSISSYKGILILDDLTDTLEGYRQEVELHFSSPTAGSFEVFEGGIVRPEQPKSTGNFTLGARTLLDSAHPDWQYREDFEGVSLDGALWSPYTDSGRDEVAVANGLLSVLIDSQSLESDTWAGLDSLRVLPMSESWEVQTRVVADVNRLAGVNNYEIGILLSNYDGVGSGGFQIHLEDWGLSAGVINRTSPWDAFRYAHTNALPGLASAHLRIVHDSSASVVSLAYDVDGITNGWNWEPLIEYQLSDGSGTRWIDGIPEPFSGGTWTLGQDDYLRVDLEAHVSATNGAYNAQAGDLGFDSFEIDSYTPPVIPVDSDGDGLDDSVETNTGIYESLSDTGTDPNNADSSGDGLFDGAVVSAGFNPNVDYSSLIAIVPNSTVDMNLRSLRLERAENGAFNMNFDLEMSTDLETWTPHTSHSLDLTVPDQSKTFMRLNVK